MTADQSALRRSPLQEWAGRFAAVSASGAVTLQEVPFVSMLNLRIRPGAEAQSLFPDLFGCPVPGPLRGVPAPELGPGTSILWLGPDEWLISGMSDAHFLMMSSDDAGGVASVVDVSANRTTIRLGGPRAREVLEKGVAIDLHPRVTDVLEPGQSWCAQTLLTSVPVILWRLDDDYRILVRPSFAAYIADWLLDASIEYAER